MNTLYKLFLSFYLLIFNTNGLIVEQPPSIAGYIKSIATMQFGTVPPLYPGINNLPLRMMQPANGCTGATNADQLNGSIALIQRGV
jgi:hypothetical protein